jgi:c-di-GMP-binding flagellar brake protein YcgR
MFFRRKKKAAQEELRQHYRRQPSKKDSLGAKLTLIDGRTVSGDLFDASAGGVGVQVTSDRDPSIPDGTQVVLTLSSLHHGTQLQTAAVTCSRREFDGCVRYGLMFVDAERLFENLDNYFVRFLNRRRVVRVRPALDVKLKAQLKHGDREETLVVHDLSMVGIGLVVNAQHLVWIERTDSFDVHVKLPKMAGEFTWPGERVHLAVVGEAHRGGLKFNLSNIKGQESSVVALKAWVAAREAEMARWDASS